MRKTLLMLAGLVLATSALAQASGAPAAGGADLPEASERAAIRAEREQEEERHARAEVACYARFAVNDCLKSTRAHRREVLDRLRRRELMLNDAERKRQAAAQLERIQQKTAPPPP